MPLGAGLFHLFGFFSSGWLINDGYGLLCTDIWVGSNFHVENLLDRWLSNVCFWVFRSWLLTTFLCLFQVFHCFSCSRNHIVFGIQLVFPVNYLIDTEGHAGPDLSGDGWRFNRRDDLVLELSHDIVDEEDGSPCGEHAHWNIVEGQSGRSVFANLYILPFSEDSLNLHWLGKRRSRILAFEIFILENIFCLICDLEVYKLAAGELVSNFNRKFNLFIK